MQHSFARYFLIFLLSLLSIGNLAIAQETKQDIRFHTTEIIPNYVKKNITINAVDAKGKLLSDYNEEVTIEGFYLYKDDSKTAVAEVSTVKFNGGVATIENAEIREQDIVIKSTDGDQQNVEVDTFSAFLAIIPPLIAIALAIITKEVLLSLFIGIWTGVFILRGYHFIESLFTVVDHYIIQVLSNGDNVHVIVFSLSIGGVIGIVRKSGGIHDTVDKISRWARTPRSGMLATWLMGLIIFFDDYANTLLVGNSMRPITDRLRISREKLSYIVDSTAAPICSLFFISTWIGAELGYIGDGLVLAGQERELAFKYFLSSLPFHFYSIFTIFFVFYIAFSNRDFGPMLEAEKRARSTGEVFRKGAVLLTKEESEDVAPPEGKPHYWWNAIVPIAIVIFVTLGGIFYTGYEGFAENNPGVKFSFFNVDHVLDVLSASNSFKVLVWAAFAGSIVAGVMVFIQRILSLTEVVYAWVGGVKSMMMAMMVLVLAWTLKDTCGDLGTDKFIYHYTKDLLHVNLIPVLAFIISAVVAFSTGTSWGTMGLLFPFILPLAINLSAQESFEISTSNYIILGTIGSILAGASFGDHCSPISDTTVMSSMASACDHIDHVRTQIPYALSAGAISCVVGYLPTGFGMPWWVSLPIGFAAIVLCVQLLGKPVEEGG